jgi:hypothetical protein
MNSCHAICMAVKLNSLLFARWKAFLYLYVPCHDKQRFSSCRDEK